MPRRKKLFKLNLKKESLLSVSSVLLILLAALTLVSFFTQVASGPFFIQEFINRYFGWGSVFVPFILATAGLLFFSHRPKFVNLNVFLGMVLFTLSFLALTHLIFFRDSDAYELGRLGQGGGVIGYNVSGFLSRYFTTLGALLILLSTMVIANLIFFNTSVDKLITLVQPPVKFVLGFLLIFFTSLRRLRGSRGEPASATDEKERNVKYPVEKGESLLQTSVRLLPLPVEPLENFESVKPLPKEKIRGDLPLREETVRAEITQVWEYPPLSILSDARMGEANRGDVPKNSATIESTLNSFGIRVKVVEINKGPAVTQYALESAQGTKIAKIKNLQNDLALALASPTGTVRIEAPIPGKSLVGVEVPNVSPSLVTLRSILTSEKIRGLKSKLLVSLGLDVSGEPVVTDIKKMPHILIAGSTGSGKSTLIHAFLATLLFRCSPDELRFILVDTKRVELTEYNGIAHLLTPVITDSEKVLSALKWTIGEMERRYKLFQNAKVRDIDSYNDLSGFQALPYIIILVDELADMMQLAPVEVEKTVCRLAQMARATGIHLVLATQRPSVDVLTGLIKANIPCRIAFNVTSQVDSRVIIDQTGAEKLLGRGDMLYLPADSSKPVRIQGVYVSPSELRELLNFIRSSNLTPAYEEAVTETVLVKADGDGVEDELFNEAVGIICEYDRASASLLQRRLKVGYARAARLLDEMERKGIVGRMDGSKPREVLIREPSAILREDE